MAKRFAVTSSSLKRGIMTHSIKTSFAVVVALMAASCAGNKEKAAEAGDNMPCDTVADVDIKGEWCLENIVFSDSVYVRPSEEVPGSHQYMVFGDSTYFIQTNCNTFSGSYTVNGDSITIGDGGKTEMACDNMATEDAICKILPNIATVYVENDSIARLDSRNPSEYIVLRKAAVKCKN